MTKKPYTKPMALKRETLQAITAAKPKPVAPAS